MAKELLWARGCGHITTCLTPYAYITNLLSCWLITLSLCPETNKRNRLSPWTSIFSPHAPLWVVFSSKSRLCSLLPCLLLSFTPQSHPTFMSVLNAVLKPALQNHQWCYNINVIFCHVIGFIILSFLCLSWTLPCAEGYMFMAGFLSTTKGLAEILLSLLSLP